MIFQVASYIHSAAPWKEISSGFIAALKNYEYRPWISSDAEPQKVSRLWETLGKGQMVISIAPFVNVTFHKMNKFGPLIGLTPKHLTLITYGGYLLTALNAFALYHDLHKEDPAQKKEGIDRILSVICKATPYVLIITRVALFSIQIGRNKVKAIVGLVMTGYVILDLHGIQFYKRAMTVAAAPLDMIAFYHKGTVRRLFISYKWAICSGILQKIGSALHEKLKSAAQERNRKLNHAKNCTCRFHQCYNNPEFGLKPPEPPKKLILPFSMGATIFKYLP